MRSFSKSLPLLFSVLFALPFLVTTNAVCEEKYYPPVPDKTKTLPADDGGVDGCDSSRFKCVMGGESVLDKQTGLVWARDPYIHGKGANWEDAVKACKLMDIGGTKGWRLPTQQEFLILVDTSQSEPALPEGHPFINLKDMATKSGQGESTFWTSTDYKGDNERAWIVWISTGINADGHKLLDSKVWPVRDGE